jgi:rhamnogalacturonyl hydrolase YesR
MAPPFIAYYGVLQGGIDEPILLMTAYDQCRLYRDALHDPASGLWRHVVYGSWQDNSHWATGETPRIRYHILIIDTPFHWSGNAWAAAGMLRVLQTLRYSRQASNFVQQQADLTSWIHEIVDSSMNYQVRSQTCFCTSSYRRR